MVVYEVELAVQDAIAPGFLAWLPGHVAELLALPGFLSAGIFAIDDPPPAPGTLGLCVRYELQDRAALEAYFAGPAAALRADGVARFGERFQARRRILSPAECVARSCDQVHETRLGPHEKGA